jgi:hypothetical protein
LENTTNTDVPKAVAAPIPTTSVAAKTFSFALDNVSDEIPQGRFPLADRPILELAFNVAHDDVQPHEVEQTQHESQIVQDLEIFADFTFC